MLLALIYKLHGESDTVLQFVQITVDSLSVLTLFLIALELFSLSTAIVSGVLAAISPQFAYFSVLLLPDSLIVFPILLAVYLVVRFRSNETLPTLFIAGGLIGLSCWLRANALFLPLFLAALAAFLSQKGKWFRSAGSVIAGAILVIAPITIKNAIIYHRFIPISLGAGQTLLEGIADYDEGGSFGIPRTDLAITQQEAEWSGKPEYAGGLFDVDGIERDRRRVRRGFGLIWSHPIWFAGVVAKRSLSSTRLDPVPVITIEAPLSHKFNETSGMVQWQRSAFDLASHGQVATKASVTTRVGEDWIRIAGDETRYGNQITSESITVEQFHDYVLRLPFKLEAGRVIVSVQSANGGLLSSQIVDVVEGVSPANQPENTLLIPFVTAGNSQVRLVIANNATVRSQMLIGTTALSDLGQSSMTWLRYVRIPLHLAQMFFKTAWFLPFVIVGIVVLIRRRRVTELAILLTVPAYYLTVQSLLHTERRYVYVIHYFLTILVAVSFCWIFTQARRLLQRSKKA